ncbi:MAG: hypothetical protein D5S03_08975 [Desulfonatronospira sp. MSAO_Bac3]|nr:MAG: hypothetical protein D5S03_08975 [Desulfonatronospira sp. MSAO_Bac3]
MSLYIFLKSCMFYILLNVLFRGCSRDFFFITQACCRGKLFQTCNPNGLAIKIVIIHRIAKAKQRQAADIY